MNEKTLDISWKSIFKISLIVIAIYLLYLIKSILIWFIFALVISVLFNPAIDFLKRRKIPRVLGAIFVYVGFFGIFILLIYLMVPVVITESKEFAQAFPDYFDRISPALKEIGFQAFTDIDNFFRTARATLETMTGNIFNALFLFFGGLFTTLFIIVTAFFISIENKVIEKTLMLLFPKKYEAYAFHLWERCEKKVTSWFGARILACIFVGVLSYIMFLIFGVEYAFTLSLFAGVFNFIPYIGPLLTSLIIFLIVFPTEMLKAIFVLVGFILIQQIENNIISPILMKKIVGLPPALVLIALVIGGTLWGILGAILVIPLFGILFEFLKEFLHKRKERESVVV